VLIADFDRAAADSYAKTYPGRAVQSASADAREPAALANLLRGSAVVINCTNHKFNLNVMEAALSAGVGYVDLGGLFTWTRRQLRLKKRFTDAGLTAVLGMGCAPGLTNVMAAEAGKGLETVQSIRIRVGSIDRSSNSGEFAFPYSAATIIEELTLEP